MVFVKLYVLKDLKEKRARIIVFPIVKKIVNLVLVINYKYVIYVPEIITFIKNKMNVNQIVQINSIKMIQRIYYNVVNVIKIAKLV